MKFNKLFLSAVFATFSSGLFAQIAITNTQTPEQLVQNVLVGNGVTVLNIEFNASVPNAQTVQVQAGYFDATGTTFPIQEGIILSTGNVANATGPNNTGSISDNIVPGPFPGTDPDLIAISTNTSYDQAMIEFDFIPEGDSVEFKYVFASDEYPEWSPSSYNDCFGFFISGPGIVGTYQFGGVNIAQLPNPQIPVTINNVNPTTNSQYYVNTQTNPDIQFDGRTVVLTAAASVQCGETYHIKLGIADAGDGSWDSGVFLEANSFSSNGVDVQIASATGSAAITEACDSAIVTFVRPDNQSANILTINYTVGGTATNGVDYPNLPGSVTFPAGEDSVQFYITPSADALVEGTETITLSVEIVNQCGDTIVTTAIIEIVDPLPYNVLTTDVNIDCSTPNVDVTASTDGGVPTLTYDWGIYGTGATVQVPGDVVGTTTYNVTVTDACGQVQNGSIDVTLTPAPEPTINFNQNTFVLCPGETANIDASIVNPYDVNQLTYSWAPTGETTEDISASPVVLTWYYLTVFDGCYNVTDSVKVDIGQLDLTGIAITDATNCPGQPGTPGSINVSPNDPLWSYTLIGGGNSYGPQNNGLFSNLSGGVTYFLNVVSDDGCSIDTAVTVGLGLNAVTAVWVLDSLRHVTCFGDDNGGAYVTNIQGGITAPYDVTWTHTSGLFDSETVNAGGSSEQDNLFGGQWVVTVTDQQGCAWSQLFTINEPGELTLDWTYNDPTCYQFSDGSVQVNTSGGNGGNIIVITNSIGTVLNNGGTDAANQLSEGWYYATITDSKGCFVEDSVQLDDPGEIQVDWSVNQPTCYGLPSGWVFVDSVYNATGDYSQVGFYWNPNPSTLPNGQGANFVNHLGPGNYTLTINDENGCDNVFDFSIAYPPQLLFSELGTEPAYCRQFYYQSGNGVVFAAATGGTPDYDYVWTNLQTGTQVTNTTWGGLNPGQYSILIYDSYGCQLSDTITLDSLNPVAEFNVFSDEFDDPNVYEGTAVVCIDFTNMSQYYANPNNPQADTTFFWNLSFDPANIGEGWQVTHDYNEVFDTCFTSSGEYEVCLVAINKNGCTDTTCKTMIIYDPLLFTPVNVFTPNGDGDNDVFTFRHWAQAVAEFKCTIVNRWGVTVHEMNSISDEWDGTDPNGSKCVNGVYFYVYEGVSTDGTELKGQGNVTIIGDK
ncbi:MAG: choice-of-anchor L domain-containing protein [Crocinitomicaceae bacterium]